MSSETVTPIAARLTTFVRQDDNPPRNGAISAAVNVPDETISKGVVWLDENKLSVEIDGAGILALLNEELTDYAAHRASAVFHNPADTTNTVSTTAVTSLVVAKTRANLLKAALLAHFANTGGTYHDDVDDVNGPLLTAVPDATDVQSLRTLVIAIKTYYNAHRTAISLGLVQVHPTNDGANIVTTADPSVTDIIGPITVDGVPVPGAVDIQTFTAAGTWTKPTVGIPSVTRVLLIGNGGGGGSGARGTAARSGGAGGAGGARVERMFATALLPATVSVTFGAFGAGGAAQTVDTSPGNNGTDGGAVSFGTFLQARGGLGGQGGQLGANSTGGTGGIGDSTGGSGGGGVSNAAGVSAGISAAAAGGGGGGGADGASYNGGNGGVNGGATSAAATGGTPGNAGQNAISFTIPGPGNGGGGGGGNNATSGGAGGAGGSYGGGGGAGGASENGFLSGAGGNGHMGFCQVITYF